jgi:hypothetical protein
MTKQRDNLLNALRELVLTQRASNNAVHDFEHAMGLRKHALNATQARVLDAYVALFALCQGAPLEHELD